jgi:TolB-like protein/class 3 adenylate cyclase/Tfp pilus assembly protein PilF
MLLHMAATRRLSAILAADVAAYSRLMGADEEGTLARLNAHRRDLIDPKIREHRGRIVKTTGDGALVEFASVVDAVRCAVEVQRGMAEREPELLEDQRVRFRIGINLGDIIVERGDIFGDGVNVAARLEALAEPGGICISRVVRNQIRDKLPYEFEDRGEQIVKNIARPVRVDALSVAAITETPLVPVKPRPRFAPARTHAVVAACAIVLIVVGLAGWRLWPATDPMGIVPRVSLVVLPFANLSNDPEQDYLVDSITDDLTTDLSRIDGSFVISRTTASTYKGKSIDVKQIGRELGVRYVLEGSVRRLGEQVEVNVQLINATSGAHVWADRFDTDRTNLATAQGRLAHTLDVALTQAAGSQIADEKNPDARDLVLRGWALYYGPVAKWPDAQHAFEDALKLDPQSIGARIGLATILVVQVNRGASKSRDQDLAWAEKLALEAVERNPNSAQAYFALGTTHRAQNRLPESRTELEKGITIDRNHPGVALQLGITLLFLGEPEAALPHLEQALRLNPGSAEIHFFYFWIGYDHLLMDHVDRAVDYLGKACAALPQSGGYRLFLASALGLRGDTDEAKKELAEAVKFRPAGETSSMTKLLSSANFHDVGAPKFFAMRKKTFEAGLLRAGLPEDEQ